MAAPSRRPRTLRLRGAIAVVVAIATSAGFLGLAAPASAAGPWFVAPTPTGANTATCGLAAATPCATVTFVIAKAAFVAGDTINVAPGTYVDRPLFQTKGANVVGTGAGAIFDGSNVSFAIGSLLPAAQSVTLTNLTLRNGNTGTGGGLAIGGGQFTTNNVTLSGNKSPAGGGAYVAANSSLTMNGGAISGNTSTASATAFTGAGAGVYVVGRAGATPAGILRLNNVTVSNNTATGGATAAAGNGGGIFNAGTTVVTGSTFNANQAVASSNANARRGQGGAIFNGPNDADDAPSLTVTNTTITGGLPSGSFNASSGGAIANADTIASGFGVAGSLSTSGLTLTGNSAVVGGGLYNGGTATVTGGVLQTNTAFSGAGFYQGALVAPGVSHGTTTFDGTSFLGNVASGGTFANFGNGGAIFNTSNLTVKNGTFTGNQAVASSVASTVTAWGGAIYNGPYTANDAPVLTITDSRVNGGAASGGNAVVGGGVANVGNVFGFAGATNGKIDATRLTLSANVAQVAGGVYTGGASTFTDSTFDQNKATHTSTGFGGGLYSSRLPVTGPAPVVTLDNTDVTGNNAAVLGGGVAIVNGVTLEIRNGSDVSGNSSAVSAGGIYTSGALTVRDSTVGGNTAAFQAGGIYNGSSVATDAPALTLLNAVVRNNTAANVGGGLLTTAGATLTATGGQVSGNSAVGGGGAYVGDNAAATFTSTDFTDNTATAFGGGAIINAGSTTFSHSLLANNHAIHTSGNIGVGGAIYSGTNTADVVTRLRVEASTISGNDAWAGAALITYSPGSGSTNTTTIDRSTIHANTNITNVGSIEQFHPLTVTNSTITDNTAAAGASGALTMVAPSTVGLAGNILSGNSGGSCSGAPVDGGYNLADPGDASCGFTAVKHDISAAPQLGLLSANGGDTPTRLPAPASPALDRIPAGTATTLTDAVTGNPVQLCGAGTSDQRDGSRPEGAQCDVGSVEVVQTVPTVDGPGSVHYSIGNAGTPVTFTSTGTPQPTLSHTGALPPGVTFHDNGDGTATLSGTPTAGPGGVYTVAITATNEAGSDTMSFDLVLHEAPVLGGPASDTYTVGQPGGPDEFHMVSGYPDADLSTSSDLPGGVTFTPHSGGTATIEGTPVVGSGGVYPISIVGTNGTPPDYTHLFTLTVHEASSVSGPASAEFTVGSAGSSSDYTATGTPVPTLSATGLPTGLGLVSTGSGRGRITGTAANGTGGEYDVTVTASNGVGADATTTTHVTVYEAPELTGPNTARFVSGSASTIGFSSDGYPGATLTAVGALPPGVSFQDFGDGSATISGTAAPGSEASYDITVRASNGIDPDAVIHLTLVVVPPVAISTTTLPSASVGTGYGTLVSAIGGQPAYHFTVVGGSLPTGLTLADDGTISGNPAGPVGVSTFTVKVTDSSDPSMSDTRTLSITVGQGTSALAVDPVLIKVTSSLGLSVKLGVVGATLTGGSPAHPIAGQTVVFRAASTTVCSGVTAADGKVTCTMSLANTVLVILNLGVSATYAGSSSWLPASGSAGLLSLG